MHLPPPVSGSRSLLPGADLSLAEPYPLPAPLLGSSGPRRSWVRRLLLRRYGVALATVAGVGLSVVASVLFASVLANAVGARVNYTIAMATLVPLVVATPLYAAVFSLVERLCRTEDELFRLATTDALTRLLNRRRFLELAADAIVHSRNGGSALSLLLIDVDHFKQVNDELGHEAGDAVLQGLGLFLLRSLRGGGFVGRVGGEEFAVVLPATNASEAEAAAERMCRAVAANPMGVGTGEKLPLHPCTVSIGVAELGATGDLSALMRAADRALYRCKAAGRNRVDVEACP